MSRVVQVSLGSLIVLSFIAAPIALAVHQQAQTRNFRVVRPGVLYSVSGFGGSALAMLVDVMCGAMWYWNPLPTPSSGRARW